MQNHILPGDINNAWLQYCTSCLVQIGRFDGGICVEFVMFSGARGRQCINRS